MVFFFWTSVEREAVPNDNISIKSRNQAIQNENSTTFHRFYHVFEEYELENLILSVPNLVILKSYYDQGNWCVIFKKVRWNILLYFTKYLASKLMKLYLITDLNNLGYDS